MADAGDQRTLAERVLDKVFDHEGRIKTLEVSDESTKASLRAGTDRMHATDRRVDGIEGAIKDIARDVASDNRAANEAIKIEIARLSKPLPWWVRSAIGAAAGIAVTVLAFVGRMVWDQRTVQAEQSQIIRQIEDSASRQEATLKALDTAIRGAPGKVTP